MSPRPLRTAEVAKLVGVHPNTVRLYEEWGFIPPVPRSASGYRLFDQNHVDLMRLARTVLQAPYPGGKEPALEMVRRAVAGDLIGALESARAYQAQIQAERAQAEAAVETLQRWAQAAQQGVGERPAAAGGLRVRAAARLLNVTANVLRSWERDGLLHVPRDPGNRYRAYGPAEIGRLRVIRMLRRTGYSTMAILRALQGLDEGRATDLRAVIDTPRPDEDVLSAADRWLSTLTAQEQRARDAIVQLEGILTRR